MSCNDNPGVYGAQQRWRGKFWAWDLVEFRAVPGVMIKRYYPDEDGTFPMVAQQTVHFPQGVLEYCLRTARNNGLNFDLCEGMPQEDFRQFSRAISNIEIEREFPEGNQTPEERDFGRAMDAAMAQGTEALLAFLKNTSERRAASEGPSTAMVVDLSARRRKP